MESYESSKSQEEIIRGELKGLIDLLSEKIVTNLSVEYTAGTYEIETEMFTLTFVLEDDRFEIRNIDVRSKTGIGSEIIAAIHNYADDNDLEVIACNVVDTARGFWEKMGYQEASEEGEYFRVV